MPTVRTTQFQCNSITRRYSTARLVNRANKSTGNIHQHNLLPIDKRIVTIPTHQSASVLIGRRRFLRLVNSYWRSNISSPVIGGSTFHSYTGARGPVFMTSLPSINQVTNVALSIDL